MSLKYFESFQNYSAVTEIDGYVAANSLSIETNGGPDSRNCLKFAHATNASLTVLPATVGIPPSAGGVFTQGYGIKIPALPGTETNILVLRGGATERAVLTLKTDGHLVWYTGNKASAVLTSTIAVPVNERVMIEVKVDIKAGATGSVAFQVNGLDAGSLGSVQTVTNIAISTDIRIGPFGLNSLLDTLYGGDASDNGDGVTDFVGPCQSILRVPTVDTAQSDFTPSSGSDNFAMVDEILSDGATTINESATEDHEDQFTHAADIVSERIFGVKVAVVAAKTETGVMGVKPLLVSGSGRVEGAIGTPAVDVYSRYRVMASVDPDSGTEPFDADAVNALKFGYKNETGA